MRTGTLSRFCIGSLKSANGVGNINTAKSLQKNTKQYVSRQKGSPSLGQVVVWNIHIYNDTCTFIELLIAKLFDQWSYLFVLHLFWLSICVCVNVYSGRVFLYSEATYRSREWFNYFNKRTYTLPREITQRCYKKDNLNCLNFRK